MFNQIPGGYSVKPPLARPRPAKAAARLPPGEADRPASCQFTEVVEGRLLGPSRLLEPVVAWLLQRQATADLGRFKHLLETSTVSGSAAEEPAT
jgi:hypothetical protein